MPALHENNTIKLPVYKTTIGGAYKTCQLKNLIRLRRERFATNTLQIGSAFSRLFKNAQMQGANYHEECGVLFLRCEDDRCAQSRYSGTDMPVLRTEAATEDGRFSTACSCNSLTWLAMAYQPEELFPGAPNPFNNAGLCYAAGTLDKNLKKLYCRMHFLLD